MSAKFINLGPWHVKSPDGFTVQIEDWAVIFVQGVTHVEINYEWLLGKRIGLFPVSKWNKGLAHLPSDVVTDILTKVQSALEFIGFGVEFFDY